MGRRERRKRRKRRKSRLRVYITASWPGWVRPKYLLKVSQSRVIDYGNQKWLEKNEGPKSSAQVWNNWIRICSSLRRQAKVRRWLRFESSLAGRRDKMKTTVELRPWRRNDRRKLRASFWGELRKGSHAVRTKPRALELQHEDRKIVQGQCLLSLSLLVICCFSLYSRCRRLGFHAVSFSPATT